MKIEIDFIVIWRICSKLTLVGSKSCRSTFCWRRCQSGGAGSHQTGGAGGNGREGGEEQEPYCQEEQLAKTSSAIEGSDQNLSRFHAGSPGQG